TEAVGKWNVDIDLSMKAPNFVNNFFGWGNESIYNQHIGDEPDIDVKRPFHYYRYRFEEWRFEPSLWRKIRNYGSFRIGPAVQRIEVEEPDEADDRFIETFASTLPYNLFNEYYTFAGVSWQFAVDQRDHAQFTRRGIVFNLAGRNMAGLDGRAGDFSSYETSLSLYHSFRQHSRVVFAARTGFGLNTGTYDFYQAQVLDGKTELRGFRKTRFYGDRKFYSNFELRLRLLNFRSYLFPASMGILGFHDLGRVWYKDDAGIDPSAADGSSGVWHKTVGGGIWFTPFNAAVLSTEVGHSNEGNLVYVRLGFLF
ncbi:MAG: BamA/TamA family outer membrane protein, partial [Bacteroidota bacterium]